MKLNDIEDILRSKLRDVPMETVPHDWTAIQRSLGLAPKRSVLLGRILATAVACLAALVVGGLLLLQDPAMGPVEPLISSMGPSLPITVPSERNSPTKSSAVEAIARFKQTIDRSDARLPVAAVSDLPADIVPVFAGGEESAARNGNGESPSFTSSPASDRSNGQPRAGSFDPFEDPFDSPRVRRSRRGSNWMLALFADGATLAENRRPPVKPFSGTFSVSNQNSWHTGQTFNDLTTSNYSTSSGPVQERVLFNSSSALQMTEISWNHQAPLAFGLSARKNLTERWGVEVGLTYTYLLSKTSLSTAYSRYDMKQQLHYLGIPVSISYTPLRRGNFELYGRLGGAVDLNIAGKRTDNSLLNGEGAYRATPAVTRFTSKTPQWSVAARLGLMYNFSPTAGIYLEPGVGHYFENDGQPESYWTDHPTHFNLQVGVRTTF